jgi:uncharacterized protein YukE
VCANAARVLVTEERAAVAIAGLGMEEAVSQACEGTKGQGYEVAYEEYKRATSRCMNAFIIKAKELGHTWPRS